jgi:hypothetical protein
VWYLVIRPVSGQVERRGDGWFLREILRLLLLGYLDSNQEQMIGVSVVPLPRNWAGIPRISAVFMGSSVRAGTE